MLNCKHWEYLQGGLQECLQGGLQEHSKTTPRLLQDYSKSPPRGELCFWKESFPSEKSDWLVLLEIKSRQFVLKKKDLTINIHEVLVPSPYSSEICKMTGQIMELTRIARNVICIVCKISHIVHQSQFKTKVHSHQNNSALFPFFVLQTRSSVCKYSSTRSYKNSKSRLKERQSSFKKGSSRWEILI